MTTVHRATTELAGTNQLELTIGGMTCASCAMHIEKKLNGIDGVEATVNYATEKAKVTFDADVAAADLVAAVESAGYTATLPVQQRASSATDTGETDADSI